MMLGALKIKLQLIRGDETAMGPGKADLLEAIVAHGSISAAGRAMGMSYRRAWILVDEMNRAFAERLVTTASGGGPNGGARLTETGTAVLAAYRELERAVAQISDHPACRTLTQALKLEGQDRSQVG
jgi:molybdate transport system regulatory protein